LLQFLKEQGVAPKKKGGTFRGLHGHFGSHPFSVLTTDSLTSTYRLFNTISERWVA